MKLRYLLFRVALWTIAYLALDAIWIHLGADFNQPLSNVPSPEV